MDRSAFAALAFALGVAVCAAQPPQGYFATAAAPATSAATQAELDQLLAPIALYPDVLLGQVLAASTYPLEVVSLHRWLEHNAHLEGAALEGALAGQPWDPAVKALAPFRPVVATMNAELEWMQRLGDAFLAREADVMDAVQRLRRKAMEAGSLGENPREKVVVEREIVYIEPADPEVVHVPVYDARVVYGPWWWPGYPPYYWGYPWYGPIDYYYGTVGFAIGIALWPGWYHHHPHPDWHGRHLSYRRPGQLPSHWTHNPLHRGGVPYTDSGVRDLHAGPDHRVRERQDFRGFEGRTRPPGWTPLPGGASQRPRSTAPRATAPAQSPPSALNPIARDSARVHAERGRESLRSAPPQRNAPASPSRSSQGQQRPGTHSAPPSHSGGRR